MQIGVSNMSWNKVNNLEIASLIKDAGFEYIESVYSKLSNDFPVKAIQSIFYGSGITSLDDTDACINHIQKIINDCKEMNIKVITFGSPTVRVGGKEKMNKLLTLVDKLLDGTDIKFCIEPNARYYGAEYYNTLEDIVKDLVKYKNITSMIDVGNSLLEGNDPVNEYDLYKNHVSHIHFAEKDLKEIIDYDIYSKFYRHLESDGFDGLITYEFSQFDNLSNNLYNFMYSIKKVDNG